MAEEGMQIRKRIPHSRNCKRLFLHHFTDPDCAGCIAIKNGEQPRMTRAQAYAMLKRKGRR